MKNNIFNFATSELSQDAFLCYIANAFNDDKRPKLRELSTDFVHMLMGNNDEINSVEVIRQFSKNVSVEGETLKLKIDVLLIVNDDTAIIIEDKTYSSLHDSQISRYRKGLEELNRESGLKLSLEKERFQYVEKTFDIKNIVCVYLKTGAYYPEDEENEELKDVICIHREEMLNLLSPYIGYSEIVSEYYDSIMELDKWYRDIEEKYYTGEYDEALFEAYGQLVCAKDLFHGSMVDSDVDKKILIETGSSFGRPFTWIWLTGDTDKIWLGYRIDKKNDKQGNERYTISFKQYFDYKKLDKEGSLLKKKQEMFDFLRSYFNAVRSALKLDKYVVGGNNGSYKESNIADFFFDDYSLEELRDNLQTIGEDAIRMWNFFENRKDLIQAELKHDEETTTIKLLSEMYTNENPIPICKDEKVYWKQIISLI